MSASLTVSWWQYAKWMKNIGRNMRITGPQGLELVVLRSTLQSFWDPVARTGSRPWLDDQFKKKAVASSTASTQYRCNIDVEPTPVLVELVNVVAVDLGKIPITDAEKIMVDFLIGFTGNRRYGTGPYFGGVAGSTVAIP